MIRLRASIEFKCFTLLLRPIASSTDFRWPPPRRDLCLLDLPDYVIGQTVKYFSSWNVGEKRDFERNLTAMATTCKHLGLVVLDSTSLISIQVPPAAGGI
jgi:hypothetical protein